MHGPGISTLHQPADISSHHISERPPSIIQKDQSMVGEPEKVAVHDCTSDKLEAASPPYNGNWYIRLPLWAQTTILILGIGFTSILLLVTVSAVKVYHYSENLIRDRLSNLAGMTSLQFERIYAADANFATLYLSNPDVIQFFKHASTNSLTLDDYFSFDSRLVVDSTVGTLWGMNFYDTNLTNFYSYRHRGESVTLKSGTDPRFPYSMFPLSARDLRANTLSMLSKSAGAVMANFTFPSVDEQGYWSFGYSITHEVYSSVTPLHADSYTDYTSTDASDLVGYITFVFQLPIYSTDSPTDIVSSLSEPSFGKYDIDIVRERDVNFNNSYSRQLESYYGTLNVSPGKYRYILPSIDTIYSVNEFPVLYDAFMLTGNVTANSSNSGGDTDTSYYNSSDINSTIISPALNANLGLTVKMPVRNRFQWDEEGKQVMVPGRIIISPSSNNSGPLGNVTFPSNSTSTSTAPPSSTSTNSPATNVQGDGDVIGKATYASLVTKSPFTQKATIGYSFAIIYNEKWLIFVEVPKHEAFSEIVRVRNLNIYVATGVLGAVLLIVLPLSRWQTQGVYVIYKNMQLRPLFILNNDTDSSHSEDDYQTAHHDPAQPPHSPSNTPIPPSQHTDNNQTFLPPLPLNNDGKTQSNTSSFSSGDIDASSGSHKLDSSRSHDNDSSSNSFVQSINEEKYRFTVPLPLPQLKRWYTDELDELVDEFNTMVEKLNSHYHHLEDQVKLRTREAQKAGELREKANIAKSEFIAIISHELRTPLNGIMGLTAVNAEETDMTKIRSGLETIIDSGRILMDLLNELLVLSKSLVGVEPAVTEFTPKSLLEMLSNLFISRANSLSTNFSLGTVPSQLSDVRLMGDVDHIVQICVNFMSNAMKFSHRNGNVSVILHMRPLCDPCVTTKPYDVSLENANAVLEILVTDSGTGISKSQLARIFDLFVQGDNPLRKNHKGAGLGMALSKQLAEGIGGYVAVFSAEQVGSTVALRVPVHVLDLTSEEIVAMNGPLLEFRVHDVYSTTSLQPGVVRLVQQASEVSRNQDHQRALSSVRNGRHTPHSSIGSRMQLTKSGHTVTRLLRTQTQAQSLNHNRLSITRSANNSTSRTPSFDTEYRNDVIVGNIEAVSGTHPNTSASSLLLNAPTRIFESESSLNKSDSNRESAISTSSSEKPCTNTDGILKPNNANASSIGGVSVGPHSRPAPLPISKLGTSSSFSFEEPLSATDSNYHLSTLPNTASTEMSETNMLSSPVKYDRGTLDLIQGMRILLAEDNKLNQQIMVKMLQQLGVAHVDTADDGNMVVSMVEKSIVEGYHYNVIFMDLSMPGKSGIEATQIIRGTLGYPYPVVALTGFSDLQTRNACLEVNIEEVLIKPVMKGDIVRVLERYANFVDPSSH